MNYRYKLKDSIRIKRIRESGKAYFSPLIVLIVQPVDQKLIRIAVIASKTVGGAVTRNRCKRKLREAVKRLIPNLINNFEVIILARKKLLEASVDQIETTLENLLKISGVLRLNN